MDLITKDQGRMVEQMTSKKNVINFGVIIFTIGFSGLLVSFVLYDVSSDLINGVPIDMINISV